MGIPINVEDSPYIFQDDVTDHTTAVSRLPNASRQVLVPRGGKLELEITLGLDGVPDDIPGLLNSLIDRLTRPTAFGREFPEIAPRVGNLHIRLAATLDLLFGN